MELFITYTQVLQCHQNDNSQTARFWHICKFFLILISLLSEIKVAQIEYYVTVFVSKFIQLNKVLSCKPFSGLLDELKIYKAGNTTIIYIWKLLEIGFFCFHLSGFIKVN